MPQSGRRILQSVAVWRQSSLLTDTVTQSLVRSTTRYEASSELNTLPLVEGPLLRAVTIKASQRGTSHSRWLSVAVAPWGQFNLKDCCYIRHYSRILLAQSPRKGDRAFRVPGIDCQFIFKIWSMPATGDMRRDVCGERLPSRAFPCW